MASGILPDDLFTQDMTVTSTTSPTASPKEKYQIGIKLLQSMFDGGLAYTIDSLTAEDDRVVAEVRSHGTLVTGHEFHCTYVFIFRLRDGRIAAITEHFNPAQIQEKLAPLMNAALGNTVKN